MYKVLSLMKRKEETPLSEFIQWARVEHPVIAMKIPGLKRYEVNVVSVAGQEQEFDAVNALYFEDEDACNKAFATSEGQAAGADASAHTGVRYRLIVDEFVF